MLLAWRTIATLSLTKQWQYTELTAASFFRITHVLSGQPLGTVRGSIGQSIEAIVFDRRLIGYRPGFEEGQLFVKPEAVDNRPLALQRLDELSVNWTVKVEELINLATSLPLSIDEIANLRDLLNTKAPTQHQHLISDVPGLAIALDEKVDAADLATSEQLIFAQIAQKAPIGHGHVISDVTGLSDELAAKAIAIDVSTALNSKSPIVHGHGIADVAGLENELEEAKSIIISQNPPTNPYLGLWWHETNAQGLVDLWQWDGSVWVSGEKSVFVTQSGTGTTQAFIPLSSKYNYRWLQWRFWLRSGRVHQSNEYALPNLKIVENLAETDVFKASEPFAMPVTGTSQSYEYTLVNKSTITTEIENRAFSLGFSRIVNANYTAGSEFKYQMVRK